MIKETSLKPKLDKPLASTLLAEARDIIQTAESFDVTAFRNWLLSDPTKPLICIGNGGKHTSYAALLYEMGAAVARTVTPLEFALFAFIIILTSPLRQRK